MLIRIQAGVLSAVNVARKRFAWPKPGVYFTRASHGSLAVLIQWISRTLCFLVHWISLWESRGRSLLPSLRRQSFRRLFGNYSGTRNWSC